ncbi:MAG: hypothetical protein PHX04_05935 [Bacilli bacterium]|nr:hypothetical protein [Bacilli bacterium]
MKQVFQCDYCTTILPKIECQIHENICSYNPENKSCYSCKNARLHKNKLEYCKLNKKLKLYLNNSNYEYEFIPKVNCEKWGNKNIV